MTDHEKTLTVREAVAEGSASLAAAGIESSSLDSSLLLAEVLRTSRSQLLADSAEALPQAPLRVFRGFVKRRLAGESVAYITGKKEFYGLEFRVNRSVLVPRPETELLVEAALKQLETKEEELEKGQPVRVLDLCTGCGAIAIALKNEMPELEVWAADISAEAIEVAKSNAARLLPPESIHFFYGDLYNTLTNPNPQISNPHYLFTVVVSNPPYIPTGEIASLPAEVRCEPVTALDGGSDGLEVIRRIISRTDEFLCHGGVLLLEADPRQMESIGALLKEKGFQNIQTQKDLSGKERIIICQNV